LSAILLNAPKKKLELKSKVYAKPNPSSFASVFHRLPTSNLIITIRKHLCKLNDITQVFNRYPNSLFELQNQLHFLELSFTAPPKWISATVWSIGESPLHCQTWLR
jgi:hypothetical protein